ASRPARAVAVAAAGPATRLGGEPSGLLRCRDGRGDGGIQPSARRASGRRGRPSGRRGRPPGGSGCPPSGRSAHPRVGRTTAPVAPVRKAKLCFILALRNLGEPVMPRRNATAATQSLKQAKPDPFYGWRYVHKVGPDGREYLDE